MFCIVFHRTLRIPDIKKGDLIAKKIVRIGSNVENFGLPKSVLSPKKGLNGKKCFDCKTSVLIAKCV